MTEYLNQPSESHCYQMSYLVNWRLLPDVHQDAVSI